MKAKKILKKCIPYVGLVLAVVLVLLPIASMVLTAMKSPDTILSSKAFLPEKWSLHYFRNVLEKTHFLLYLWNSVVIGVVVSAISTIFSILAGYSLSRYKRKAKELNLYVVFLLALQMFPVVQLIIPLYLRFQDLGLTNTRMSVFIAYITFTLPLNIWMMQSFFDGIPYEIEESGKIDGCNKLQCLYLLIVPVSGPGISSVAIFAFNYCWNEYLIGSLMLKKDAMKTMSIGLQTFMQEMTTDWGSLTAASTLALIPVLLFLVFMQKYIITGMTAGSVKG